MARDFHTAMNVLTAKGKLKDTEPSNRYYLADARFLVGLESHDLSLLQDAYAALHDPYWPLYLGRKAFVPGEPVWLEDGLCENTALLDALKVYPWLGCDPRRKPDPVRFVLETPDGEAIRPDQPISFSDRRFAPRRVTTMLVDAADLPGFQDPADPEPVGGAP